MNIGLILLIVKLLIWVSVFFLLQPLKPDLNIIYILALINLLLFEYNFRFQRTTLGIARVFDVDSASQYNIQSLLSPNFFVVLVWFSTILSAVTFSLLFHSLGWLSLIYLFIQFFGTAFVDKISPFPAYKHYFYLIECHIKKKLNEMGKAEDILVYSQLQEKLQLAKKLHEERKLKV